MQCVAVVQGLSEIDHHGIISTSAIAATMYNLLVNALQMDTYQACSQEPSEVI
jgi:hypothetical protein